MILADTSIWVDHLRSGDPELKNLLNAYEVCCHPLVVAEIALGSLRSRGTVLRLLDDLPVAKVASINEVRTLIEARSLYARGVAYVDASLLAACLLEPGTRLWTRDKRLARLAEHLGLAYQVNQH